METSKTIGEWATKTFGYADDPMSIVNRAGDEFLEMETALYEGEAISKIRREIADTIIVLMHLMDRLGGNAQEEIDAKMQINRSRQWKLNGDGTGSHI